VAAPYGLKAVGPVHPGGQTEFIAPPLPPDTGGSIADSRAWALTKLREPLTLAGLAAHAHISTRTLTRRFRVETGLRPMQWLTLQRSSWLANCWRPQIADPSPVESVQSVMAERMNDLVSQRTSCTP
jgi:methylphosphotriester-DNA--protein-cysteine methyltransferase